jgi:hypothetical protein
LGSLRHHHSTAVGETPYSPVGATESQAQCAAGVGASSLSSYERKGYARPPDVRHRREHHESGQHRSQIGMVQRLQGPERVYVPAYANRWWCNVRVCCGRTELNMESQGSPESSVTHVDTYMYCVSQVTHDSAPGLNNF